jgi:hypothetical protein
MRGLPPDLENFLDRVERITHAFIVLDAVKTEQPPSEVITTYSFRVKLYMI